VTLGLLGFGTRTLLGAEEILVSHILLRTKADAEKVKEEIINNGGDAKAFREACWQHTKDGLTRPLGGNLDWMKRRDSYDPAFKAAAFNLREGEISEPVKSEFGWHLIRLAGRRESETKTTTVHEPPTQDPPNPLPPGLPVDPIKALDAANAAGTVAPGQDSTSTTSQETGAKPGPGDLAPPPNTAATANPGAATTPSKPVVEAKRRALPTSRLTLSVELVTAAQMRAATTNPPSAAVEVTLTLRNLGQKEHKVPPPTLLPLGFRVKRQSDEAEVPVDFSGLAEPESFFRTLKPYEVIGTVISLNDYFKTLNAESRYDLSWDVNLFFTKLEEKFPKVKELEDYSNIQSALKVPQAIEFDRVLRSRESHLQSLGSRRPYVFGVFDLLGIKKGSKLFARIKLQRETTPVFIDLSPTGDGQVAAVRQFTNLALEGYYDTLNFFDVRKEDYALGGCPSKDGTGAPAMSLQRASNTDKIPHKRGTVSFVSRPQRKAGPQSGGQIGSIFFVCLKDHPEWDEEHVPFGTVVSGIEVFDRIGPMNPIESVAILSEADYKGGAAQAGSAAATPQTIASGNSEAVIKTAKGELIVTLHEDAAQNTVASFINLAETGYFDKTKDGNGKQTFYELLTDNQGKVAIFAGSPTNDPDGDPGYALRDEVNDRKCERGALVLARAWDDETKKYAPDSGGSQFFICLRDIPPYDYQGFTVFGKVIGGTQVLDQLAKGDFIESVKVTKKRTKNYAGFDRIR
jgi:cyclophilin family peptidyl-prolyl cis-trans isomerase